MDQLTLAQEKTFKSAFGNFTVKIPSLPKRIEIGKRMQRYAEGLPVDPMTWDIIEIMATLDVTVTEAPDLFKRVEATGGWDYDQVYDEAELFELGKEVVAWLNSFRRRVRAQQDDMGKTGRKDS